MKKINKTRKITENDLRNLHYIHENEGLIPAGVTKLEDEDITSAEVITEDKENPSPKEFTEKDYEKFCKSRRVSLPYEKVKLYMEQCKSFTKKQLEYEEEKSTDIFREKKDLEEKLEKGEITQEEYDEKLPDILRRWLKVYRMIEGGADPKWFNPDTMQDIDPDINKKANEAEAIYNIDFWTDKKNPDDIKEETNSILRMLGYPSDPNQSDLEEIIRHFDIDYNGDSDYEEYIVTLLGYYCLMFGRTEFYKNYVSKYGVVVVNESSVETNNQYWEFVQKFKESVGEDSEIYKELMTQLQAIKDYDVHAAYNLTKEFLENKGLWDEYSSDFEAIPINEDDMDEFQKLIDSDVWKKFKEDWNGTDVYDAAMDAISYVDTLPQMINGLKRVFDVYDMLVDYEAGLDKLLSSSVNEDDIDETIKLSGSDVWRRFCINYRDTDVKREAVDAVSHEYTLTDMINAAKKVFDKYGILEYYEEDLDKLLSTSVNEYKTVGVYKPNDGEVEDLYYIQAGDIILIHHKDYGELQCKVKKVDADKNKVYFVTIERGIMGVCGFDKIHGIQLVEECQKQPMFVQTKHIKFPEGGMCYMCYAKVGNRFVDVYCTFGMSLDNCECIKLLNMTADEFGIIDNIMSESDTFEDAKNRVYNSGLVSL